MRGYQARTERRTSGSAEQRAQAHIVRADVSARAQAEPADGASKTASLLQLQHALDQSPRVRSQVALQRVLDRTEPGGKVPQKREKKPALQTKRVAIGGGFGTAGIIQRQGGDDKKDEKTDDKKEEKHEGYI